MGKKSKGNKKTASLGAKDDSVAPSVSLDEEAQEDLNDKPPVGVAQDSSDDESVSSEEDDDLVLEGVVVRNPDVPSSSSDEDDSVVSEESDDEKLPASGKAAQQTDKRKAKASGSQKNKPKKQKTNSNEPGVVNVEFTFCDMAKKYFHGLKTHLLSSTIYAAQSSALADAIIDNISVGTVISTEGDDEGNVYGFASVLPVKTEAPCIEHLKKVCMQHCPDQHKEELKTVLSGQTRRPAGFLIHGRMINLPLEIVEVLHQQLVLDMDWAVKNAEGGEEERKSLDFGAFVRMAPAYPSQGNKVVYKYFDDEVLSANAEFVYNFEAPKSFASEEKQICSVIVMTKTGHRQSMEDLEKLIQSR